MQRDMWVADNLLVCSQFVGALRSVAGHQSRDANIDKKSPAGAGLHDVDIWWTLPRGTGGGTCPRSVRVPMTFWSGISAPRAAFGSVKATADRRQIIAYFTGYADYRVETGL